MNRRAVGDYQPSRQDFLANTPLGRLLDGITAEQAKEAGMARAYRSSEEWRVNEATPKARYWLLSLPDGTVITTDDLRNQAGIAPLPKNQSRVWWGPYVQALCKWGWLTEVGVAISRRRSGHGNETGRYRVNRAAVARGVPEKGRIAA